MRRRFFITSTNHIYNSANPTAATAFSLKYVGTGTAATATVSGGVLSTTVTGGPGGQNLRINLGSASYDTLGELTSYISSNYAGVYTVTNSTTPLMRIAAHSSTLASFTGQDIKTAAYGLQFAIPGLMTDACLNASSWAKTGVRQ
ncbi:MAG TPA: hypothetical protein VFA40_10395 [Terriglobales bacterium]|nr:hypothetical protein [Terriglobales bacterium]